MKQSAKGILSGQKCLLIWICIFRSFRNRKRWIVINNCIVCFDFQIPATTVRILLNHFKWDKEKLMERYYSDEQDAMFAEARWDFKQLFFSNLNCIDVKLMNEEWKINLKLFLSASSLRCSNKNADQLFWLRHWTIAFFIFPFIETHPFFTSREI